LIICSSLLPASFQERSTSSAVLAPSAGQRIHFHLRAWQLHRGGSISATLVLDLSFALVLLWFFLQSKPCSGKYSIRANSLGQAFFVVA
jgi:hypothetical protein